MVPRRHSHLDRRDPLRDRALGDAVVTETPTESPKAFVMKNQLTDLNNHLFASLSILRLASSSLSPALAPVRHAAKTAIPANQERRIPPLSPHAAGNSKQRNRLHHKRLSPSSAKFSTYSSTSTSSHTNTDGVLVCLAIPRARRSQQSRGRRPHIRILQL